MTAVLAATLLLAQQATRFELAAPLPLPPVHTLHLMDKSGIAQSTANRLGLQARIMWIDATANLGEYNTEEKIAALCKRVADVGFNTLVFDVKPIDGYTVYPSKLTDQITFWRDAKLEQGFDPLKFMVAEAHKNGLVLLVSMNAFSEGHRYAKEEENKADKQFFKPGWGYDHPDLQTTRLVTYPALKTENHCYPIDPKLNPATWSTYAELGLYQKVPTADLKAFATLDSNGKVLAVSQTKPDKLEGQFILASKEKGTPGLLSLTPGQTISLCDFDAYVRIGEDQNQIPLMMNPHLKANQDRALAFVQEVTSNYAVDGLLYDDRLRFGGLDTDFSNSTLGQFKQLIKKDELDVRTDIYRPVYTLSASGFQTGLRPGLYFDDWLAFRARTMANFVKKVRQTVKKNRPNALFGIYAGSWYGDYPQYGSNYASSSLSAGFPFLTHVYQQTGFASSLDLLVTGAYYKDATVWDSYLRSTPSGRTVEAAGLISNRVARDESWTVAGIQLSNFWDDPAQVQGALQAAAATTQGVMVFDYSHKFDLFEPILKKAFSKPAEAPYQIPGLLQKVRTQRADFDAKRFPSAPFPLFEGAPGTGF